MTRVFSLIFLFCLVLLSGCKGTPDGVISPNKMKEVLVDVHITEAVMEQYPSEFRSLEAKQSVMANVFERNNITKADFDSSMVYYSRNLNEYMRIYQDVEKELNLRADVANDSLLVYERSLLSPVGDSVDVWKNHNQLILSSELKRFASLFELKGDSNYRENDVMRWQMHVINADSVNPVYFSIAYRPSGKSMVQFDTVFFAPTHFEHEFSVKKMSVSDQITGAWSVLNVAESNRDINVFIDDIKLMRYRAPKIVEQPDSLASDSLGIDSLPESKAPEPLKLKDEPAKATRK